MENLAKEIKADYEGENKRSLSEAINKFDSPFTIECLCAEHRRILLKKGYLKTKAVHVEYRTPKGIAVFFESGNVMSVIKNED